MVHTAPISIRVIDRSRTWTGFMVTVQVTLNPIISWGVVCDRGSGRHADVGDYKRGRQTNLLWWCNDGFGGSGDDIFRRFQPWGTAQIGRS